MPTSPSKLEPAILDSEAIIAELEDGGAVAQKLTHYEPREAQLGLMRLIIRAFNEDALCAAEAGTGVGKSFAYLLPAVVFAEKSGERVVISTATITLQQQLFEKDVPLVTAALGLKIKTALVKGRGNFLCRRRLDEAMLGDGGLEFGEVTALEKIAEWAKTAKSGAKSDMPFLPEGGIWAGIASDADTCLGMRCAYRETCFFMIQRREAAEAKLLIVNHHLLFADIAARAESAGYGGTVVLPSYKRIVIDEAHTIEDAATSFFSGILSRPSLNRALGRLLRQKGAKKTGLLLRLNAFAGGDRSEEWLDAIDAIRTAAANLDGKALELCGTESVFRFIPQRDNLISDYLEKELFALKTALSRFSGEILELVTKVEKEFLGEDAKNEQDDENSGEEIASEVEILFREIRAAAQRLAGAAELCGGFLDYKAHAEDVFWVERRGGMRGGEFALWTRAPVDIASKLACALFAPYKTVVCVSATLTVSGRFDYWMLRSGIVRDNSARNNCVRTNGAAGERRQILSGNFPSPFPYNRAVLLAAPTDAPLPSEPSFRAFVNNAVLRLVLAAGGSALVLWTSFESLESCFREAAPALEAQGIKCLKQGEDDRSRLLRTFLLDESSVLFATDSFWEGVDAPGDTLRLVLLCRLPFKMPNDPVFQARCEAVERQGGNAFMDISVPEAVIKFRQGFGRLMRRSSDYGVIAVLDSRVIKKRYGEIFLRSLPKTKYSFIPLPELIGTVERFLDS